MDIEQFWAQSEGKWFSQRTCYQLGASQADNSKADLTATRLAATEPSLQQLSDRATVPASQLWGGVRLEWDTSQDWQKPKQLGSALLAFAPESDRAGQLWRVVGAEFASGRYQINSDNSLTLSLTDGDRHLEERLWFASENLRLRISTVQVGETVEQVAFYSEIRRLPPKQD